MYDNTNEKKKVKWKKESSLHVRRALLQLSSRLVSRHQVAKFFQVLDYALYVCVYVYIRGRVAASLHRYYNYYKKKIRINNESRASVRARFYQTSLFSSIIYLLVATCEKGAKWFWMNVMGGGGGETYV